MLPKPDYGFAVSMLRGSTNDTWRTLVMPGWLGYAKSQYLPVLPALPEGTVLGVDYTGTHFRPASIAESVANACIAKAMRNEPVVLVGSSLGAMVTVFTMEQMVGLAPELRSRISAVLIDPPSGAESLKAVPSWATSLVPQLRRLPQWLNGPWGRRQFAKAFCQGLARNAIIELPPGKRTLQQAMEYNEDVRRQAREAQQGFTPTLAFSELAWMARVGRDGSLQRALQAIDGQFNITYLACIGSEQTGENEVVRHPLAGQFYRQYLPSARHLLHPTNHINYLEFAPTWCDFLSQVVFGE
ncbi:MAG: alpha/beta hydrolase [Candidatus Saccharimonas sp.]